ncbi:unnamed protein product [Ambrosiozyma monospora]|uniref:Unnamed protein product n=1 Tax=Ambrosiozyma monospora TaxID=43982 RepID=A0A9W7DHG6_AMBMO|nr:unnamed protein product [Ambrosiozyma monospora]
MRSHPHHTVKLKTEYCTRDAAALQVLSQLLTFKYLHGEIREKGGAYGGGASYDALNSLFSFYSYRDPKPGQSITTFNQSVDQIIEKIEKGVINPEEDLEQAKLTIFQKIDAPMTVREEGMSLFNFELDDDLKQERREYLLDCSLDDVKQVAEKYFSDEVERSSVIIGTDADKEAGLPGENWTISKLS